MTALRDISEETGYSVSTVSRALDNSPLISRNTRQIIRKVAIKMNYDFHNKQQLKHSCKMVGVIIPDISNYFFSCIVQGINAYYRGSDFVVVLFDTGGGEYEENVAIKKALSMEMSGLIVFSGRKELDYLKEIDAVKMPVVVIGSEDQGINVIDTDNKKGAYLATKHLLSLGHTHIGVVSGHLESKSRLARLEGYKEALVESGILYNPELVWEGSATKNFGYSCALEFLQKDAAPSAVITQNDMVALGVMAAAEELGVKIPDQLAVVGYDNTLLAAAVTPHLTSVMQPQVEMGHIAAEIIEELVSGKKTDKSKIVITPRLIIRESTIGADIYNNEQQKIIGGKE
ncbi:MAG: LacI family transcriptional regulator [Treponema sp.]|jgi:LacI family transcriptional regulator|nr:LacI family transcriptional regulator [Treponema sp.]